MGERMADGGVIDGILEELRQALLPVGETELEALAYAVAAVAEVFVTGQGRSGLMGAAFATRLAQLGKRVHVVGSPTTTAAGRGAVLIACSGSGRTRSTVVHAQHARALGAQVWAVTGDSSSPLAAAADRVIAIPAAPSIQPGRSVFEQALLVLFDTVVLRLMVKLGQTAERMDARHANLE
jgi:6-phospho-3-hexuloisomerase